MSQNSFFHSALLEPGKFIEIASMFGLLYTRIKNEKQTRNEIMDLMDLCSGTFDENFKNDIKEYFEKSFSLMEMRFYPKTNEEFELIFDQLNAHMTKGSILAKAVVSVSTFQNQEIKPSMYGVKPFLRVLIDSDYQEVLDIFKNFQVPNMGTTIIKAENSIGVTPILAYGGEKWSKLMTFKKELESPYEKRRLIAQAILDTIYDKDHSLLVGQNMLKH